MNTQSTSPKQLQRQIQYKVTRFLLIGLAIFLVISLIPGIVFVIKRFTDTDPFTLTRMFDDVAELSVLDEYAVTDAPKLKDYKTQGLEYTDSYLNTIEYKDREFQVYAYEFVDKKTALEYFDRVGDAPSETINWSHYMYIEWWDDTTFIAFCDNCVIVVIGHPADQVEELINWLSPHLSIDLEAIPKYSDE
jgi:hypothetical protein